jgi:hypothetical protein
MRLPPDEFMVNMGIGFNVLFLLFNIPQIHEVINGKAGVFRSFSKDVLFGKHSLI